MVRAKRYSKDREVKATLFYGMAFLSGTAALIYQVAWVHTLTLTFGSTTVSAAVVIAAFMAGLGLGARCYDIVQRRWKNNVMLYAGIECGIALTAAALTLGLRFLPGIYGTLTDMIGAGALLDVTRFTVAFTLLLIPSALIGATFPALSLIVIRSPRGINRHLGMIYGINTLGAAVGTLLSGFVLIELLGNTASVWFANALNIAVAAAVYSARSRFSQDYAKRAASTKKSATIPTPLPPAVVGIILIASSFATMAYELVWMRATKYLIGNSTYAVSLVLALFLIGLGLGSAAHRLITQRYRPAMALTASQVMTALLSLIAIGSIGLCLSDAWLAERVSIFSQNVSFLPWPGRLAITGSVVTVALLPATFAMGLMFPLASSMFVGRMSLLGRKLGSAYLLSNVGSIAGVVVAAYFILPGFGTMTGTKIVACVNLAGALLLLCYVGDRLKKGTVRLAAIAALSVLLMVLQPSQLPFQGEGEQIPSLKLEMWEEGQQSTVKVLNDSKTGRRVMTIDGYAIGVSRAWHNEVGYKQMILAHLPMALSPGIKKTLNIGLGSGSTMASLGGYPTIEKLDCVEISPAVVDGARLFDEGKILDDPRSTVYIDDVVHYMRTSRTTYDAIISDGKQNPQFPGNAKLLAGDFYTLVRSRLADDGIFVQWIPLNEETHSFKITLRTFEQAFPHAAVYYLPPSCIILVGTKIALQELEGGLDTPSTLPPWAVQDLAPYHITSRYTLLTACASIGPGLREAIGDGPVNSWDRPCLEFLHYKEWKVLSSQDYFHNNLDILLSVTPEPADVLRPPQKRLKDAFFSAAVLREGFLATMRSLDPETLRTYCVRALELDPANELAIEYEARIKNGLTAVLTTGP